MGILKTWRGYLEPRTLELSTRTLVGRSSNCTLRLVDTTTASAEHALIAWDGRGWTIKDLRSRNGTWADGERIAPGKVFPLIASSWIAFGQTDRVWQLEDASPPRATARHSTGTMVCADHGVLVLPTEERPVVSIFQAGDGRWVIEREGEVRPAEDGQPLTVDGDTYALALPTVMAATADNTLHAPHLTFVISRDEEHARLEITSGAKTIDLPGRAHLYTLALLARARLADRAREGMTEAEEGWLYRDDLERMTGMTRLTVNTHVSRARHQLAPYGLSPGTLVQRRAAQMRIGIKSISVSSM